MADETRFLFIDTNSFLQVRDLKDVPWKELFPGVDVVDVMVAPRVIEELDNHKNSANQRRRDRARLALELIEKASLEPGLALVMRATPILVRLVISTAPRFDWNAHPSLDPAKPDDQLIAEALSFGRGASVFSHDTGPRIRARVAGIGAYTPKPEWLLPVEQTDDQRKIKRLERDLEQVLSQTPKIVASIDDVDQTTREVRLFRPVAEPLGQAIVYDLASKVIENNPRALLSTTKSQMMLGLGAISESDAERYNSSYETFQESVFMFYQNLHDCIARLGKAAKLSYLVRNESGIAAEGLRIEFDLEGEAWLLADRTDAKEYIGDIKLPQAPEAPRSRLDFTSYPISNIPTFRQAMEQRDPVGFYWFHRPGPGETHSALQCQDFRATREFRDEIFVLPTGELPVELRLRLHVSAANLPVPVNLSVKLVISDKHVQWSDIIVRDIFRLE